MKRLLAARSRKGQSMVEFALILPVIMFLILGMVEMGFAINHNVSIQTATRQGARVGAIEVNGDPNGKCGTNDPGAGHVDPDIVSSIEGALTEPGASVKKSQVTLIEIFGLSSSNAALGTDKFTYNTVTGHFQASGTAGWPAAGRCGAVTGPLPGGGAPRIGVRITYTYKFITPLGAVLTALGSTLFGTSQITMTDTTIMALEPPKP
jgi:hypothetical protein